MKKKVHKREVKVFGIYDSLGDGIYHEFVNHINKTSPLLSTAIAGNRMPHESDEDARNRHHIVECSIIYTPPRCLKKRGKG